MDAIPMLPVWAILLIPLASALVIALFLQRFDRAAATVGIAAIGTCFLLTLSLPFWTLPAGQLGDAGALVAKLPPELGAGRAATGNLYLYRGGSEMGEGIRHQQSTFVWAGITPQSDTDGHLLPMGTPPAARETGLEIRFGVMVDNLAYGMLLVVTLVGLLVHIFSVGYLAHEGAWGRYFAGLSLFCFSMLGIVLSPNYFQTFIFWELVGVSSYILIGHYYQEDNPPECAKKAFMTNRVADFGFMIGILFLFFTAGTVDFHELANLGALAPSVFGAGAGDAGAWTATAIGILLFVGCMGKSAQFPFHIWLPDAMAGPTPVSALMHAATMVAAGVYLVLRSYPVYTDGALHFIAWIGAITALMAGLIAMVQFDIKKVLAYSTLSQLGYMMLVLGLGGYAAHASAHYPEVSAAAFKNQCYTAGMFHLTTHAFFKALLFLCSGAVIAGMHHHQDMREMGGLLWRMPWTAVCYAIGAMALAGIPPFAGFWSKDMILHLAHQGSLGLYLVASVAAFCTAFYMTRAWFMTFMGEPRTKHADEAHEVGASMLVPLFILAALSIVAGLAGQFGIPGMSTMAGGHGTFPELVYFTEPWHPHLEMGVALISFAVAVFAFGLGLVIYGLGVISPDAIKEMILPIHTLVDNKFYCDDIAMFLVKKVQDTAAKVLDLIEQQLVIGVGIYGFASLWRKLGGVLRYYQTGNVRDYAALLLAGTLAVLIAVSYTVTPLGG